MEATASPEERMHDAFRRCDARAVRQLFERHAELRERINAPVFSFDSPAIVACANDRAMVDVLLDYGADPNRRSEWWAGGFPSFLPGFHRRDEGRRSSSSRCSLKLSLRRLRT